MISLIIVYYKILKKEIRETHCSWKEIFIFKEFCTYLYDFLKITFGWYSMMLGYQGVTFIIGITKDVDLLASWTSLFMIQGSVWVMGAGISATVRNDVTHRIGQERPMVARKYAIIGIILSAVYS